MYEIFIKFWPLVALVIPLFAVFKKTVEKHTATRYTQDAKMQELIQFVQYDNNRGNRRGMKTSRINYQFKRKK